MTNTPNTPWPTAGPGSEAADTAPASTPPPADADDHDHTDEQEGDEAEAATIAANLRAKDRAVLTLIGAGTTDVRSIREATETRAGMATLSNAEINWAFEKLSSAGLVTVKRFPGERVTRTVAGQQRSFDRPKEARLTAQGEQVGARLDDGLGRYAPMEHSELVRTVRRLDEQVTALDERLEGLRRQVLKKLRAVTDDD